MPAPVRAPPPCPSLLQVLMYLNRLSDYLFTAARFMVSEPASQPASPSPACRAHCTPLRCTPTPRWAHVRKMRTSLGSGPTATNQVAGSLPACLPG